MFSLSIVCILAFMRTPLWSSKSRLTPSQTQIWQTAPRASSGRYAHFAPRKRGTKVTTGPQIPSIRQNVAEHLFYTTVSALCSLFCREGKAETLCIYSSSYWMLLSWLQTVALIKQSLFSQKLLGGSQKGFQRVHPEQICLHCSQHFLPY